jgi:spermidine synthase
VTVVELEEAVVDAARVFSMENRGVVDHPRVRLRINDGRNHLLMTDSEYDVITVDPIHPFGAGSSSLYSREFYELCRDRLRAHGVMCQWLPLYQLAVEDVAMIIKTFQAAFPHSSVWLARRDVGLIGTLEPLEIEFDNLLRRVEEPDIRPGLEEVNLADPYALVSRMILGEDELRVLTDGARLNTDDHLVLEYTAPRSMYTRVAIANNLEWLTQSATSVPAVPSTSAPRAGEWLIGFDQDILRRFVDSRNESILGFVTLPVNRAMSLAHFERALAINPDDPDAADQIKLVRDLVARTD